MKRENLNSSRDLKRAMLEIELSIQNSKTQIQQDFDQLKEDLKPQNLIRTTLVSLGEKPEVKKLFINAAISVALGYFSRLSGQLSMQSLIRVSENIINDRILLFEEKNPDSFLTKAIHFLRKYMPKDSLIYAYIKSK